MKIAIIGCGNMGSAFARSLVAKDVVRPENLIIFEHEERRRYALVEELKISVRSEIDSKLTDADVIVLAVKPQDFDAAAKIASPFIRQEQFILSFMAGVTLEKLSQSLNGAKLLVRSMPNLPFVIGEGMTVYMPYPGVPEKECLLAEVLLKSSGTTLRVEREDLLDAATAISGTGPGYVYYFIEHLMRVSEELGFTREESQVLIAHTMTGAVNLWVSGVRSAEELRAMVTSKRGTTHAATEVFDRAALGEIFREGVRRAYVRSKELSSGS